MTLSFSKTALYTGIYRPPVWPHCKGCLGPVEAQLYPQAKLHNRMFFPRATSHNKVRLPPVKTERHEGSRTCIGPGISCGKTVQQDASPSPEGQGRCADRNNSCLWWVQYLKDAPQVTVPAPEAPPPMASMGLGRGGELIQGTFVPPVP